MSCFEQGEVGIISVERGKTMLPKKLEEIPVGLTTIALYDHYGQLLARFQLLISEGQEGIFIENMTEGMIFYRVCKNGKPIMIPLFYSGEKKILYFQDYHHVKQEDEITLLPHTEEYIFDGSEYDGQANLESFLLK